MSHFELAQKSISRDAGGGLVMPAKPRVLRITDEADRPLLLTCPEFCAQMRARLDALERIEAGRPGAPQISERAWLERLGEQP
jgi:hypothetical protein